MVPVTTMDGARVALFGLGGSGLVTAAALIAGGAHVTAFDDNPASVDKARGQGIETADLRGIDWAGIEALVVAPGVPLTHPNPHWTVELAHRHGVPVIGDVELFSRELAAAERRAPLVAITGTNGKSTTTALIAHVFASAGRDVQMGGNIGRPVLDLDPIAPRPAAANQVYVVECSSYQIDLAPGLSPHVGVLLNLSPDHLDRHGTMENYAAIKERLVAASDLAVVGVDDDHCIAISGHLAKAGTPLERITVGRSDGAELCVSDGVVLRCADGERLVDLSGIGALRGAHNAQNALAAFAACEALGLSVEEIAAGFESFPGLAHRMEQVGRVGDTLFVNDSKATNADAAAHALAAFEGSFWIAGGLPKEGGIESLTPLFPRVAKAYLVGEAAGLFAAQIADTIPYEIAGTVEQAVNHAAADARQASAEGERVVLLSPAAASFDQFANFERRGDAFRQAVRALPGFRPLYDADGA